MPIIRPRLTDYYNIPITQEEVDFAIPLLEEDIPLYIDPFLLWKSPSLQDNSLHTAVTNSFNHLGWLLSKGRESNAIEILIECSECSEVGLGSSKDKKGLKIGDKSARDILSLFLDIPQLNKSGFNHFEEIQMFVQGIAKDRISDITASFIKSFLIDFTLENAERYSIPLFKTESLKVYDYKTNKFKEELLFLPQNPENGTPIILVPKRWLRYVPWINYEEYFESYYIKNIDDKIEKGELGRVKILNFNRQNYDMVQTYVVAKERVQADCINDPLFKQIPIISAKRSLTALNKLPEGKTNNADKTYEKIIAQLMASLLYPHLDFADVQSRIDSGSQIRDLIFYNNRSYPFLADIYNEYDSKQIVIEIKNVGEIEREHINQLNRYMTEPFGRFGIIITRNKIKKSMEKNLIDLWSGQRRCIITLTDEEIEMMVNIFEEKQRLPIEVIKMRYIEFQRKCPS